MKKRLPETSLINLRCVMIGVCFSCFLVAHHSYAVDGARKLEGSFTRITFLQESRIVTGTVTDGESNEAVPGVSIVIKGTNRGTVSSADGAYSIEVTSSDDVLVFTSIGFATQEVAVNQLKVINVALIADINSLSEVVVVGYGEQKK